MNYERVHGLIGLSIRARRAQMGAAAAEKTIRAGKAGLLLISEGASDSTRQAFLQLAQRYAVACRPVGEELLKSASGRDNLKVLVLLPGPFIQALEEELAPYPSELSGGNATR